eukprot:TRINITY_DN53334_c0_g1_i1.p1 TRINITY_DN53334_c0_g1~~TRINITY_DN53334_c0_g1_i1.p1  ORF type:complete len:203 (+),score=54.07 TRINITY_DN53334_c0_g1_i1:98-706(+)
MQPTGDPTKRTVTKAELDTVCSAAKHLEAEWEELQSDAADSLQSLGVLQTRSVYLQGNLRGLAELDSEIGIRQAFASKLLGLQDAAAASVRASLSAMRERVLDFYDAARCASDAAESVASYPPTPLQAALLALSDVATSFGKAFESDLMVKESVLACLTSQQAPRDSARLNLQITAFTTQPYHTPGAVDSLVAAAQAVAIHV